MLGAGTIAEPRAEEHIDLPVGGIRMTSPDVLPHHPYTEAVQIEDGPEPTSRRPRTLFHGSMLPARRDPGVEECERLLT